MTAMKTAVRGSRKLDMTRFAGGRMQTPNRAPI
jgi:hypothetical protein